MGTARVSATYAPCANATSSKPTLPTPPSQPMGSPRRRRHSPHDAAPSAIPSRVVPSACAPPHASYSFTATFGWIASVRASALELPTSRLLLCAAAVLPAFHVDVKRVRVST